MSTLSLIKGLLFDFGIYEVYPEAKKKTWILIDYALNTLLLKKGQCAGQSEKVTLTNVILDVRIPDKATFFPFFLSFLWVKERTAAWVICYLDKVRAKVKLIIVWAV